MARNPETTWKMLNVAFENFQAHIQQKRNRQELCLIDLLHVSNFKGGNASITEPIVGLEAKLPAYSNIMKTISERFNDKCLGMLSPTELEELKSLCSEFICLPQNNESYIRGLGSSYASALLAAYFPRLIPVLDRRVINGAGIEVEFNSQGQVKNIHNYYGTVINAFHSELSKNKNLELRDLDRQWFIVPL